MFSRIFILSAASMASLLFYSSYIQAAPANLKDAMTTGRANVAFRLRYENAKQENLQSAKATTLRTKLGFESGKFLDSILNLELVDVANFFGHSFNPDVDGLRKPNFSQIRDPKGTGITQAKITYSGFDLTDISLGRQYILLDNERFIGNENFRQYPQTFDAISLRSTKIENIEFFYAFLANVNTTNATPRSSEGRRHLHTHLVNASWHGFRHGTLTGYLYFNKDKTITTNSHVNIGIRALSNEDFVANNDYSYVLEFARQSSKFNNPTSYNANYFAALLEKKIEPINVAISYDFLGGSKFDANKKFITPLGSNHNFQGWADTFIVTPDRGLQDFALQAKTEFKEIKFSLKGHIYRFARGSMGKAGVGLDLGAGINLSEDIAFNVGYAKYNPSSQNHIPNTRRIWLTLNALFI